MTTRADNIAELLHSLELFKHLHPNGNIYLNINVVGRLIINAPLTIEAAAMIPKSTETFSVYYIFYSVSLNYLPLLCRISTFSAAKSGAPEIQSRNTPESLTDKN